MNCPQRVSYVIRQGDNLYQLSRYYKTTVQAILAENPNIDPYNLTIGMTIAICPGSQFVMHQQNPNPPVCPNPSLQFSLLSSMREVWIQHVYWTRMLLISIADRLNDFNAVTDRLMKNPVDIAKVFSNYYTTDIANTITQLLSEHLQIGASLITALRDGKTSDAENLTKQWYINADKMADAFSSINPYYNREDVRNMLYTHLDLTTQEVTERLAGKYPEDIEAFNKVEQEALLMADFFSFGILRQFPQMFI